MKKLQERGIAGESGQQHLGATHTLGKSLSRRKHGGPAHLRHPRRSHYSGAAPLGREPHHTHTHTLTRAEVQQGFGARAKARFYLLQNNAY